jgi:hydrogenase maturation protein HypF
MAVQHHHAHLAACLAEHGREGRALGVTWDGTGYGTDGTIWGGEFLLGDAAGFERVAHLLPFRLPGGETSVREPRRVALALLWELMGEEALARTDLAVVRSFSDAERAVIGRMLARDLNVPRTSSAGRLFDGVAALTGFHGRATFEGQAAVGLEFDAFPHERGAYAMNVTTMAAPSTMVVPSTMAAPSSTEPAGGERGAPLMVDWRPAVVAMLADLERGVPRGAIAARFHNGLAEAIAAVAATVGESCVALTGGCFQNRMLAEGAYERLSRAGHDVLVHQLVPPNDGGVSFGQAAVAAARLMRT